MRHSGALLFILGVFLVGGCAGPAPRRQAPPGAIVFGAKTRPGVRLASAGGFLEGSYEYLRDLQTASDLKRRENTWEGRAGLHASGSVYHPKFLRYDLAGVLGLVHEMFKGTGGSDSDTGRLEEYDGSLRLFPERFHPARVFASRTVHRQPRILLTQVESTTTILGATQELRLENWPTMVSFTERTSEQSQLGTELPTFLDVKERVAQVQSRYRIAPEHEIRSAYAYDDVQRNIPGRSYSQNRAEVEHHLGFGSEDQHDFRSGVEMASQVGEFDRKLIRWEERLDLEHSDSWSTDYRWTLTRNDTNVTESRLLEGYGGTTHRLYESLVTRARVGAARQEFGEMGVTHIPRGNLQFDYRKKNPWGVLRSNYGLLLERRSTKAHDQVGLIVDERYTFPLSGLDRIVIGQFGVIPSTIEVTDSTGLFIYSLGTDYTVSLDGAGRTEIFREPMGLIPPGGSVRVDYQFRLPADRRLDTFRERFRIEQEFRGGWVPFFQFTHQDQKIRSRSPDTGTPIREVGFLGGLEYRRPSYRLAGEWETMESTVVPFSAVRVRAEWTGKIGRTQSVTADGLYAHTHFRRPSRWLHQSLATLRWVGRFARSGIVQVDAQGRYDEDSIGGHTLGYGLSALLQYRWRQVTLETRLKQRMTRSSFGRFEGTALEVSIRRDFGARRASRDGAGVGE